MYEGASKVTGFFEAVGKPLLGFKPFMPARFLNDGDFLDIWHGLTVVHLPGHTAGHSGFYCRKLGLLFCGDLFASYGNWSHLPPPIFNSDKHQLLDSISKAPALDLSGILPNHGDRAVPSVHLERLIKLNRKHP